MMRRNKAKQSDMAVRLFAHARTRYLQGGRTVPFSITPKDIRAVLPPRLLCPVLGIRLRFGKGKLHDASPTLDRINNNWGYTKNNIAVISYRANRAKGNMHAAELERIATWMRSQGLT
jgi:hypothetical protein